MNIETNKLILAFLAGLATAGVALMIMATVGDGSCQAKGGVLVRSAWWEPVCVRPVP